MGLGNRSFEKLNAEYGEIRRENERLYDERLQRIYSSYPELKEYDDEIAVAGLDLAFAGVRGTDGSSLKAKYDELTASREKFISEKGIDPSYREQIYTCPVCRDTGYIVKEDGPAEKCGCFKKRESEILLEESGMSGILEKNNFSVMRTDLMDDENKAHFLKAVDLCRDFIATFDTDYRNIMFCGTVGTGKSFLSACIASELLASYHSVVYMSAKTLFDSLAEAQFAKGDAAEAAALRDRIYDCDLLIIDDLGTEMTNSFVGTELFTIINERFNARRSVIISTNLELPLLRDRYSDRIFSRITGSYDVLKMCGPDLRSVY